MSLTVSGGPTEERVTCGKVNIPRSPCAIRGQAAMRNSAIRLMALAFAASSLFSCAGVGFVATSNPDTKLAQSRVMMDQGRCGLAELTIGDAMQIFEKDSNQQGIADAYLHYGLLYKYGDCRYGRSSEQYKAADPSASLDEKSFSSFASALTIYEQLGNDLGAVNSLNGMAEVNAMRGNKSAACEEWRAALSKYQAGKASGSITGDRVSTQGYNNMGDVISAYLKQDC